MTGADLKILHLKSKQTCVGRPAVLASMLCVVLFWGCRRREQPAQPSPLLGLEGQPEVRVLLVDDATECLFSCDAPVTVTNVDSQLPEAHFKSVDKPIVVELVGEEVSFAGWGCPSGKLQITPDANSIFSVNGHRYRGKLQIVVAHDSNSFDVVNLVGTEAYLAGVIGAEMPTYWEPQALEAQAIAGRTYCLYIKKRFGANRHWDIRKTAANQMYKGVSVESQAVWRAIAKTAGKVLVCARPGNETEDIFPAYYASTCAGHTENSENVFGDTFGPLKGVPCKYCIKIAKGEFLNWPTVYVTKTRLNEKLFERYPQLKKLGSIEQISAVSPSRYDGLTRLTWIKLEGNNGTSDILRAEDFRLAVDPTGFKIKSAAFEIQKTGTGWAFASGKGYGHGVGMCQCGAQGMARKGKSTGEILSYYYPGSRIKKLY
jgi:stage II sporulation protein D